MPADRFARLGPADHPEGVGTVPPWVTMPCYGPGSLSQVLLAAVRRLGIVLPPVLKDGRAVQGALDEVMPLGGPADSPAAARPRGIMVILADGLGWSNLEQRRGHAPFLWSRPRRKLISGFPSTTVASLASLGTGLPPGQTALAGYSLRDPATGRRANLIKWDTPTTPRQWQPHATVFERLDWLGRPAAFVGEARFADSAMTQSSLRGARFFPADKTAAALTQAAVEAARAGDGLAYVYWGALDKVGHAVGWESAQWAETLEQLDGAAARLSAQLPSGWEIWLTADHGMIDITGSPVWDIAAEPDLAAGVGLVAGEARAIHLYCDDPPAVAERWECQLGERAWVLTRHRAIAAGLFGEVDRRVEPYLGDVIVTMAGRATVLDGRVSGGAAKMIGHHGSLTAAEMEVPLIQWCPGEAVSRLASRGMGPRAAAIGEDGFPVLGGVPEDRVITNELVAEYRDGDPASRP